MAYEGILLAVPGLTADGDLSDKQYYCVKMSTTNQEVSLCDTDGEVVLGILQNKPNAAGVPANVASIGVSRIVANESLTAGDFWGTSSTGKATKVEDTNTGADTTDYAAGVVVKGAGSGALATVTVGFPTFKVETA